MTDTSISYGSKYDNDLDVATIAKLVRADIKAAVKAGDLPTGLKASVKISRYSMGQSLTVTVKALPEFTIHTAGFAASPSDVYYEGGRYTDGATDLLTTLETIISAYNYNGSDMMTDYYNVNFSGNASYDYKLLDTDLCNVKAAALPRHHVNADCSEVAA